MSKKIILKISKIFYLIIFGVFSILEILQHNGFWGWQVAWSALLMLAILGINSEVRHFKKEEKNE